MALGRKGFGNKTEQKSFTKKKSNIKNIGGIFEGKYGQNIAISDYHGKLYFQDKETGNYYEVKGLRISDPYKEVKNLIAEVSINLENDKAAVLLDE